MFSSYKSLFVIILFFSHLGFWGWESFSDCALFLIVAYLYLFNTIMVDNYAAFFNCTPVDWASDYDDPDLKLFILVDWDWSFLSVA